MDEDEAGGNVLVLGRACARPLASACSWRALIARREAECCVEQTVARLTALLHAKGVTLFALVDYSGEAAKVGHEYAPPPSS